MKVTNPEHPFTTMLIPRSRGTCLIRIYLPHRGILAAYETLLNFRGHLLTLAGRALKMKCCCRSVHSFTRKLWLNRRLTCVTCFESVNSHHAGTDGRPTALLSWQDVKAKVGSDTPSDAMSLHRLFTRTDSPAIHSLMCFIQHVFYPKTYLILLPWITSALRFRLS